MKRNYLILIFFLSVFGDVISQEGLKIRTYSMQHVVYSPSLAVAFDGITVTANARKQWSFTGAPVNGSVSVNSRIKNSNSYLTGYVDYERFSIYDKVISEISFVQGIKLNENSVLGLGLSSGINCTSVDLTRSSYELGDYVINNSLISNNSLMIGTGLTYYSKKLNLIGSASINDILHSKNINTYLGKRFTFSSFDIDVSGLLKTSLNTKRSEVDITGLLTYKNLIGIGICYSTNNQIAPIIRANINNRYSFGYAYDFHLGTLSGLSSHEITFRAMIGNKTTSTRIGFSNPRI